MTYFFTLNQYGGSNKLSSGQAIKVLLPTQTGNAGKVLSTDGSTLSWVSSSVTSFALTKTDDTNVTLTLGGSPNTALLAATSLTLGWTGTLADSRIASAATWNAKQNALGFTPENVANKKSAVSTNVNDYYNAPYINSLANNDIKIVAKVSNLLMTGVVTERCLMVIPLSVDSDNWHYQITNWCRELSSSAGSTYLRIGTVANPIDGNVGANAIGNQSLLATYNHVSNNRIPFIRNFTILGGSSGSIARTIAGTSAFNDSSIATLGPFIASLDTTVQHYVYLSYNMTIISASYTIYSAFATRIKLT